VEVHQAFNDGPTQIESPLKVLHALAVRLTQPQPYIAQPHFCILLQTTDTTMAARTIFIDCYGDSILTLHPKQPSALLPTATTVEYQVSSHTLRAVSPYFAAIFKHSFAESRAEADGKFHFKAFDFSTTALKYFLAALHNSTVTDEDPTGVNNDVWLPREVTPEVLIGIAEIMSYYQVPSLSPVITETWFRPYHSRDKRDQETWHCLRKDYFDEGQKELMMWLSLGISFRIRALCDQAAAIICETHFGPVEDYGFPVPQHVVEKLDREIASRGNEWREREVGWMGSLAEMEGWVDWEELEAQKAAWFDFLQ
jgi:hypothetical protein